jgi:hypothetical protein
MSAGLVAITIAAAATSRISLMNRFTEAAVDRPVREVKDASPQLATYMATFILPLVAITGATSTDVLILVIFFGLLGGLLIRSRTLVPNPTLLAIGYQWKHIIFADRDEEGDVLIPPRFVLMERLSPPVNIGSEGSSRLRSLSFVRIAPELWVVRN